MKKEIKKKKNVSTNKLINQLEAENIKEYNKFLNGFLIPEFLKTIKNGSFK